MTRHETKASLLEDIRTQRSRLEKTMAELTPEQLETPGVVGEWSIKDILAHLLDWEHRFMGWYASGRSGKIPRTPAPDLSWQQLDVLNERIYQQYKNVPMDEIQEWSSESYEKIVEVLNGIPEDIMFTPNYYSWLNGESLADWAAANTCNHYYWAKTKIRNWMKSVV